MQNDDVVVIGAGPGGYVAAIRCAQLGMKTACVDAWVSPGGKPALGGTCLNVGCIPSKALLDSSHHFEHINHHAADHGIAVTGATMDVGKMVARKNKIVATLTQGIAGLFRKNGIDWLQGRARLLGEMRVEIEPTAKQPAQKTVVAARHIIIATGSVPATIPPARVDQTHIVDSTGALDFQQVPGRLGVIGAGVIGLELGSVWRRLGSEVVIFEALPDFLPGADHQIAREALKVFGKQGLDIRLNAKVKTASVAGDAVTVEVGVDSANERETFDRLIVAVGRRPNTAGIGAQEAGIELDERGFVVVDADCRTRVDGVYAVGDAVRGPMLAHKASEEGIAVAELIAGQKPHVALDRIPWVIYTWPEIAWIGATEQALKAAGREYRAGSFPFMASGRARAMGETDGFVKVLGDARTDAILGVHAFGPNTSELIAEAVLAMEFDGSTEDIARTVHAHPTLAEALHEAALGVDGRTLHI
ncbi:MAG: dihydrolipoyl dehydrogenase [Gammaproteobacteria bacterium]|nr:dihydrolipoyl dehydrogenase [Gammaproteobacteria bacterium]